MKIRKATESDIPAIIDLLKASLGDSMIPKSETLWKWKHMENPFGPSPVLLAEEDGRLIGVRAFLRWEFSAQGNFYKACRAVDTATHPDYQGQGIFKTLTTALLEQVSHEGMDLIYNTPNKKSTPGYLKMGWKKWGKLPLKVQFHLNTGKNGHPLDPEPWGNLADFVSRLEGKEKLTSDSPRLVEGYLKWRYLNCPLFPYYYLSDGESYLLFYRIKESTLGREIRICDLFTLDTFGLSQKKILQEQVREVQKLSAARFTSFSGLSYPKQSALDLGSLPIMEIGPLVTLRQLKNDLDPNEVSWNWSLGNLELF